MKFNFLHRLFPGALSDAALSQLRSLGASGHHDSDGHVSYDEGFRAEKPFLLPEVADALGAVLGCRVDPWCQIYRLEVGASVPRHVDADFAVGGMVARSSVLVRLNGGYSGGETVFSPGGVVEVPVGGAVVFPHALMHESRPVTSGVKFVLKTDVLDSSFPLDEECPE